MRRKGGHEPQTETEVLMQHIKKLNDRIDGLQQRMNMTTVHAVDTDDYLDPVQGEVAIHHPSSGLKYYHDGTWHSSNGAEWVRAATDGDQTLGPTGEFVDFSGSLGTGVDPGGQTSLTLDANDNPAILRAGTYLAIFDVLVTRVGGFGSDWIRLRLDASAGTFGDWFGFGIEREFETTHLTGDLAQCRLAMPGVFLVTANPDDGPMSILAEFSAEDDEEVSASLFVTKLGSL